MKLLFPLASGREPIPGPAVSRLLGARTARGFQAPDAAMPGPLARLYPIEGEDDRDSGGLDESASDTDRQNQDRI